ncbi:amidohydrolase family protein [Oleidesulfovibrio sp.]|uniref:amidohydrolase family protein n=1 Tax=Oleidesulfovibrio sp. TaxID=2909707 RepID=UPI003A87692A
MSRQVFVDAHCHLFNFVDVPVYETLNGQARVNTLKKLGAALGASTVLTLGFLRKGVEKHKNILQFFERPQEENLIGLAREIQATGKSELTVLTPLVMDFDCVRQDCGEDCKPCTGKLCPIPGSQADTVPDDPSVEGQFLRLRHAVERAHELHPEVSDNLRVLPFLGLDLRKLNPEGSTLLEDLQTFWQQYGVTKAERKQGFSSLQSGKAMGIKLYPPIGFNPYPVENKQAVLEYTRFYEWCIDEGIPLTVHCQSGSYSATRKKRAVEADTHASNWRNMFRDWERGYLHSTKDIKELRINFAHFGGEKGLEDMLDWYKKDGIDTGSWTYIIIDMLRNYPNTYADLSAFAWASNKDAGNFASMLDKDAEGKFRDGHYQIKDKLLWGSDVPMIVSDKSYIAENGAPSYQQLFSHFSNAIDKSKRLSSPQKKQLINSMVELNPSRFMLT